MKYEEIDMNLDKYIFKCCWIDVLNHQVKLLIDVFDDIITYFDIISQ